MAEEIEFQIMPSGVVWEVHKNADLGDGSDTPPNFTIDIGNMLMNQERFTEEEFVSHIKDLIYDAGGEEKFYVKYAIHPHILQDILTGAIRTPKSIAMKLGYKIQMMYVKVEEK